jgi:hypothetical protein
VRDIWDERKQKDDGGKNCQDKIVCYAIGTVNNFIFVDVINKDFEKLIERKIVVPFELDFLKPTARTSGSGKL